MANQDGRRASDPVPEEEQVEQGEIATVREKKSFSSRRERTSEVQSFEMQDRSGTPVSLTPSDIEGTEDRDTHRPLCRLPVPLHYSHQVDPL
jgi:hypothetical protein